MTAPDPMKGIRGVFAATLVLESIIVLLGLLVLVNIGDGATPFGIAVVVGLAVAMIVAAGVQGRAWGLRFALALQLVMIACGLLAPAFAVMGAVFAAVWVGLLLMRRDVARRLQRGELPSQQE